MTGWILYKRKIENSYETQRLVEEFEKQELWHEPKALNIDALPSLAGKIKA